MVAEDIQETMTHEAKFNALCKANGVRIEDNHSRFSSSNNIRQEARKRIEERKKRKEKLNV